jgi:glycosyltransferase involved in cell wall biosynthesis
MKREFSIMIPTFGRPLLLEHAIKSALSQDAGIDLEIIVVDNDHDSKFDSEKVVKKFADKRLRYVRNPVNLGMCGNWNKCIELASSEWMTILHDDDQLHSAYVATVLQRIKKTPELSIIGCGVRQITDASFADEALLDVSNATAYLHLNSMDVLRCCPYYPVGVAFNKAAASKINGFDAAKYPCLDYDMWYRMLRDYQGGLLSARLAFYRKFENESARGDVLAGFLLESYQIRQQVISTFPAPLEYFLEVYSQRRIMADKENLESVWGTPIDIALVDGIEHQTRPGFIKKVVSTVVKVLVVACSGRKSYKLAV